MRLTQKKKLDTDYWHIPLKTTDWRRRVGFVLYPYGTNFLFTSSYNEGLQARDQRWRASDSEEMTTKEPISDGRGEWLRRV
jgi:hypothetical protein